MPTLVEWTRPPLVPVMVNVNVPVCALRFAFTVNVDVPDPVTEVGLKLPLVLGGSPLRLRVTVPENPPEPVMVTV